MAYCPNAGPLLGANAWCIVTVEYVIEVWWIAIRIACLAESILPEERAIVSDYAQTARRRCEDSCQRDVDSRGRGHACARCRNCDSRHM